MRCRIKAAVPLALATIFAAPVMPNEARAADLPIIKTGPANVVPQCVTPGRLMAFLEQRNPRLKEKFANIAVDYMRIGNALGIRWDTAFFQMLLETGNLTFTGDVSPSQNNFAGLGATGRGAKGESFPDVATGVKAHLQHVLMYAGETIDDPVAERTRKIQEWNVLTSWHKSFDRPIGFADVGRKWAPGSRGYGRKIAGIAESFYSGPCLGADPRPELVALADPERAKNEATASIAAADQTPSPADLAKRAVEEAKASGAYVRSSLGGTSLIADGLGADNATGGAPDVKILNSNAVDVTAKTFEVAAAPGAAKGVFEQTPSKPRCNVWTASYGGSRAVIIKATGVDGDQYTVLDVNEGSAARETAAYIAAYAKGGTKIGDFANPAAALTKAFELCPED